MTGCIDALRWQPRGFASPAFAGFAFVAHLERGRDPAVLFLQSAHHCGERRVSLLMGDDYSNELQLLMQLIPCGGNRDLYFDRVSLARDFCSAVTSFYPGFTTALTPV